MDGWFFFLQLVKNYYGGWVKNQWVKNYFKLNTFWIRCEQCLESFARTFWDRNVKKKDAGTAENLARQQTT